MRRKSYLLHRLMKDGGMTRSCNGIEIDLTVRVLNYDFGDIGIESEISINYCTQCWVEVEPGYQILICFDEAVINDSYVQTHPRSVSVKDHVGA